MKNLFVFIIIAFIAIALVGCNFTQSNQEVNSEFQISETEETYRIYDATVISKFNEKEIIIRSDTSCYFDLAVTIVDGDETSYNTYSGFEISENETITLSIEDLANNSFSYSAIITDVDAIYQTYSYEKPLQIYTSNRIDNNSIMIKYSEKEITVHSDDSCCFDLYVSTVGTNFSSTNIYRKLKIDEGETIIFTLDDLAPDFFDDEEIYIRYANLGLFTYWEN